MTQNDQKSLLWPLIFGYKGTILGKRFIAEITLQGRVLASPESDGVWVYGVNPGGIAVGAPTLGDTHAKLRNALHELFIDFAQEADSFGAFKATLEKVVAESDPDTQREWDEARASVRAGSVPVPGDLRRETEEAPFIIHVEEKQIDAVTPQDNSVWRRKGDPDSVYQAAA
jgi:hypothetical protein